MSIGEAAILPGNRTRFLGYGLWNDGKLQPTTPGPKFIARLGHPMVIRYINKTNDYLSVHLHGGHGPSHSDGHPAFVVRKKWPPIAKDLKVTVKTIATIFIPIPSRPKCRPKRTERSA